MEEIILNLGSHKQFFQTHHCSKTTFKKCKGCQVKAIAHRLVSNDLSDDDIKVSQWSFNNLSKELRKSCDAKRNRQGDASEAFSFFLTVMDKAGGFHLERFMSFTRVESNNGDIIEM
eukprot:TRINITY_DN250_c1_g1_i10.p1 TRINITY_DN250_c1_g1~~TRINITY_DN250_c1_g1_i10.p1  ORF type:complete len:117 (-),score=30.93 TRINITY_DN250_c1_g1_i10:372-722(-)